MRILHNISLRFSSQLINLFGLWNNGFIIMSLKDYDEIEIKIDRKHIDLLALMVVSIYYLEALMVVSI